jgi:hypothetical protein
VLSTKVVAQKEMAIQRTRHLIRPLKNSNCVADFLRVGPDGLPQAREFCTDQMLMYMDRFVAAAAFANWNQLISKRIKMR